LYRFNPASTGAGVTVPSIAVFKCYAGPRVHIVLQMCDTWTIKVKQIVITTTSRTALLLTYAPIQWVVGIGKLPPWR